MKNIFKKLILLIGLLFIGNIFLLNTNYVFANDAEKKEAEEITITQNEELAGKIDMFQKLGQGIYTVTWPILVIAGKFMSNEVIYGSFVGMDNLLWKIWNVMRTFSNYIIGLLLIFSIFSLFLGKKLEQFNPIKIIPQLALAGILVNASWFLIGFFIDVSNILTYSVGQLPLKVASTDDNTLDELKIPTFGLKFQNNSEEAFQVGIQDGDKLLPFCELKPLNKEDGEFKTLVKDGDCVVENRGQYYKFGSGDTFTYSEIDSDSSGGKKVESENTFGDIRKKMTGMTGILGSMYASLINVGKTVSYPSGSSGAMIMDVFLKFIFLIALVIPLLTLAIVLIVRAFMLWIVIIMSPIIFLFTPVKNFAKVLGEKGKLSNVLGLIFMPVFVVFALSLSFVFLTYLRFDTSNGVDKSSIEEAFSLDFSEGNSNSVGLAINNNNSLKITSKANDSASSSLFGNLANTFIWIIETIFAIGFMRIIVFTALKSFKLTSGIADSINKFAINMGKATPIAPFAEGQSISSLGQGVSKIRQIPGEKQSEQYTTSLKPAITELQEMLTGSERTNIKKGSDNISSLDSKKIGNVGEYETNKQFYGSTGTKVDNQDVSISKNQTIKDLLKQDGDNQKDVSKKQARLKKLTETWDLNIEDLETLLRDQDKNKTIEELFSDEFKDKLKEAYKKNNQEKLSYLIKSNVLDKEITLLQLSEPAKNKLTDFINKVFGEDVKIPSKIPTVPDNEFENLIKYLQQLGFENDAICKLLSEDLSGGKLQSNNEKKIMEFIQSNESNTGQ